MKLKKPSQKQLVQMAIIIIVALWVFCLTTVVAVRVAKANTQPQVTTNPPTNFAPATTTQGQTQAPSTQFSQPAVTIDANNVTTVASVDKPQWQIDEEESIKASQEASKKAEEAKNTTTTKKANIPSSKKEIIDAYLTAVNKLKRTDKFTLVKTNELKIELDDIQMGSGSSLNTAKNLVDSYIKNNAGVETTTYNFVNSMDSTTGKSPSQIVAPFEDTATVSADLIEKATATEGKNGSYTVTLTLGKQTQTMDTPAPGYSTLMHIITLDQIGLSSTITVSEMTIVYDSGKIEATIDKDGRITSMTHYMNVPEGVGKGKMTFIPGSLYMHGDFTETYQITY